MMSRMVLTRKWCRYVIKQYGKKLDVNTETYKLEVTLERVKDQRSLEEICRIPRPSQMDDYVMYKKMECEIIKQKFGEQGLAHWKERKEEQAIEWQQWRRTESVEAMEDVLGEITTFEKLTAASRRQNTFLFMPDG
jgi:hypothetical protein